MTAAKKKASAPAPARRKALEQPPAPKAPGMAKQAADTEGNVRDISGDSGPRVGVDPRDGSVVEGVVAAPPTPTVETALTANDGPGAGGATEPQAATRRKLEEPSGPTRKVHVAKAFILTDSAGVEHRYAVGPQSMPKDHAEHWYTQAHLAKGDE